MISCQCLSNVLQAEPISLLWALTDSTGAFYWTKFRFEIQFRKFHVPNGTILWLRLHRPYPGHRAFGYCPCKQDTKERYGGQQFGQMKRNISFRLVKVDHAPSNSGRSKPKRPFHWMYQPKFSEFWVDWKAPMNYWKYVSNFPSTDWHIGDSFFNFSIMARSQTLVNTLHPRTLLRHCFADWLNKKVISVCGASCRVARCQVLRIQWNFKFLERRKVSVV